MRTINLADIPAVLDDCLKLYKEQGIKKNIVFFGQEGYGRKRTIKKWLKEHKDEVNLVSNFYPGILHQENQQGILEKVRDEYGNYIWVFPDDSLKSLEKENSILFEPRFNYGKEKREVDEVLKIVKERKWANEKSGNSYDFTNSLFLFIATAFPDDGLNGEYNFDDDSLDGFDIYEVKPTLKEVAEYLISKYKKDIERLDGQDPDDDRYADEITKMIDILSKLAISNVTFPKLIAPAKLHQHLEFSSGDKSRFIREMENEIRNLSYFGLTADEETINFVEVIKNALE